MQTRSRTREEKRRKFMEKRLPRDMESEILLRMPVKSLVRFKSACKSWNSLISEPKFTKSHFDLAAAPTERLLLLASADNGALSIDFNASLHAGSAVVPLPAPLKAPVEAREPYHFKNVNIIGSCRGFLLLNLRDLECFCVWNPITCVRMRIPYSPISSNGGTIFLGFGYDLSTDDFLVLEATSPLDGGKNRVDVFSFNAKSWGEMKDIELPYLQMGERDLMTCCGALLNDADHWLAVRLDKEKKGGGGGGVEVEEEDEEEEEEEENYFDEEEEEEEYYYYGGEEDEEEDYLDEVDEEEMEEGDTPVILTFDFKKRSFSEFPLPIDFEYASDRVSLLTVLGDSLGLCAVVEGHESLQIWEMKEYGVQSSWTKTVLVSLDDVPRRPLVTRRRKYPVATARANYLIRFFEVICSTKSGDIVGRDDWMGLVKFDEDGQLQEHQIYFRGLTHKWAVGRYTQSLLSLPLTQEANKLKRKISE